MIAFPNAKINIGLYVVEKRTDGYHNIETVFFPTQWQDALEIHPNAPNTSFNSYGLSIDAPADQNLCVKAWKLLQETHDIPPVSIHLLKNIPMGAGLGGGSSDAAFTLITLNDIYQLQLSQEQLMQYALQLGSDCAFFIQNSPAHASGRGEILTPLSLSLKGYQLLIIHPGIHIPTPWAFQSIRPQEASFDLKNLAATPIQDWKQLVNNQFETPVFEKYPVIQEIKTSIYQKGAIYASLSGSGSACYGIFDAQTKIDLSSYKQYSTHLEICK